MKNFTPAERTFIIGSSAAIAVAFVLAHLMFVGIEAGSPTPLAVPIVLSVTASALVARVGFSVAHRIITSQAVA